MSRVFLEHNTLPLIKLEAAYLFTHFIMQFFWENIPYDQ